MHLLFADIGIQVSLLCIHLQACSNVLYIPLNVHHIENIFKTKITSRLPADILQGNSTNAHICQYLLPECLSQTSSFARIFEHHRQIIIIPKLTFPETRTQESSDL
jgi:hypothetical protein